MEPLSQAASSEALSLEARGKWGEWIGDSQQWHHFATLTFRNTKRGAAVGPVVARKKFYQWLGALSRATSHHSALGFFVGQEFGAREGRLHYHALVAGTLELPAAALEEWWAPNGFSKVEIPRGRAAEYLTKYVTKDEHSQYYNWNFPRHWRP